MALLDPRPDPKDRRGNPLYVYDPGTKGISTDPLEEFLDLLPTRLVQFRVYTLDHAHDEASRAPLQQYSTRPRRASSRIFSRMLKKPASFVLALKPSST